VDRHWTSLWQHVHFIGSLNQCLPAIWYYFMITNNSEDIEAIFMEKISQPAAIGIGPYDFGWISTHLEEYNMLTTRAKQQSRKAFEQVSVNLRSWRVIGEGGHFAAHELPQFLLRADFDTLFKSREVLDALQVV
jgi:hypothetical protein